MKICPECKRRQTHPSMVVCERCHVPFIDEREIALRMPKEDLQTVATHVAEIIKQGQLDTVASKIKDLLTLKDWLFIGESMARTKLFWVFCLIVAFLVLSLASLTAWKAVPSVVRDRADEMFTSQIRTQIVFQFQEPRFSNVVHSVATTEATNILANRVGPALAAVQSVMTQNLQTVKILLDGYEGSLQIAQSNTTEISNVAEFYLLALRAQSDDADAFWKLLDISKTKTNAFSGLAHRIAIAIVDSITVRHITLLRYAEIENPWRGTTNSSTSASQREYFDRLQDANISRMIKYVLLYQYDKQTRFPLEDRLAVFAEIINHTPDILLKDEACMLIDREAHVGKNFLGANEYLQWYNNRLKSEATKRSAPQ